MDQIIQKIRTRRVELGYSFQDLADLTNMSKSTLQRYETGGIKNIPLDKVEILAKALQTTPEWILGWEEPHQAEEDEAFFRLRKGLEPYGLSNDDARFLLTVFKAHKEKNS